MFASIDWSLFAWRDCDHILAAFFSERENTELEYLDVLGAYCIDRA